MDPTGGYGGGGGGMHHHVHFTLPMTGFDETQPSAVVGAVLVKQSYREQLVEILRATDTNGHYSVMFKYSDLFSLPSLVAQLRDNGDYVLSVLEDALRLGQTDLMNDPRMFDEPGHAAWVQKQNVHARISDLGAVPELSRPNLRGMRTDDANKFMQLPGLVISVGGVRLVPRTRVFQCSNPKCGYSFLVRVDLENDNTVKLPAVCPNPLPLMASARGNKGNKETRCTSKAFTPLDTTAITGQGGNTSAFINNDSGSMERKDARQTDYQEIKLQERLESLGELRSQPRTITLVLENDLVNSVDVGNEVVVTGKLVHKIPRFSNGQRGILEPVLLVNHIKNLSHNKLSIGSKRATEHLAADYQDYWGYWKAVGRPLRGRDVLVRSVCPAMHGMYAVKLALLLVLIGGCDDLSGGPAAQADGTSSSSGPGHGAGAGHTATNGHTANGHEELLDLDDDIPLGTHNSGAGAGAGSSARPRSAPGAGCSSGSPDAPSQDIRGFCHMLLVGDPGTGKSRLFGFVQDLMPRTVYTTGVGSTAAGLTCMAVREKDSNGYRLEAGALVLADQGVCCIDEFATLKKEDRGAVLEAMEHGSLSVAKAGIVTRLPTRCTVLGACNPKAVGVGKKYNWQASDLPALTGLESPLLSRFDLILLLPDPHTTAWDMAMSGFILSRQCEVGLTILAEDVEEAEGHVERVSAQIRAYKAQHGITGGHGGAGLGIGPAHAVAPRRLSLNNSVLDMTMGGHGNVAGSGATAAASGDAGLQALYDQLASHQEALARARDLLTRNQQELKVLNERSGLAGTRYVQLGLEGLKNEDGTLVDSALVGAVMIGRVQDPRLAGAIGRVKAGLGTHAGNRLPDGRRIEDLLEARPATDKPVKPGAAGTTGQGTNGYGGNGYGGNGYGGAMSHAGALAYGANVYAANVSTAPKHEEAGVDVRWDMARLQAYILHVKSKFATVSLCPEAGLLLQRYYLLQRQSDNRNAARTTTRLVQALIRLTQAHARLMYRDVALIQDAAVAIIVIEYSASTQSDPYAGPAVSAGQTAFPGDPDADYTYREQKLLTRLVKREYGGPGHGGGYGTGAAAGGASGGESVEQWQQASVAQLHEERQVATTAGGVTGQAGPGLEDGGAGHGGPPGGLIASQLGHPAGAAPASAVGPSAGPTPMQPTPRSAVFDSTPWDTAPSQRSDVSGAGAAARSAAAGTAAGGSCPPASQPWRPQPPGTSYPPLAPPGDNNSSFKPAGGGRVTPFSAAPSFTAPLAPALALDNNNTFRPATVSYSQVAREAGGGSAAGHGYGGPGPGTGAASGSGMLPRPQSTIGPSHSLGPSGAMGPPPLPPRPIGSTAAQGQVTQGAGGTLGQGTTAGAGAGAPGVKRPAVEQPLGPRPPQPRLTAGRSLVGQPPTAPTTAAQAAPVIPSQASDMDGDTWSQSFVTMSQTSVRPTNVSVGLSGGAARPLALGLAHAGSLSSAGSAGLSGMPKPASAAFSGPTGGVLHNNTNLGANTGAGPSGGVWGLMPGGLLSGSTGPRADAVHGSGVAAAPQQFKLGVATSQPGLFSFGGASSADTPAGLAAGGARPTPVPFSLKALDNGVSVGAGVASAAGKTFTGLALPSGSAGVLGVAGTATGIGRPAAVAHAPAHPVPAPPAQPGLSHAAPDEDDLL